MNPDDSLFNVKPAAISDKVRRIAKNAGVNIHVHSLRHGYATRLLEKRANIKAVQELLGHSRIGTTEAYLSLLPEHLRETVELLDSDIEDHHVTNSKMPQLKDSELPGHEHVKTTMDQSESTSQEKGMIIEKHLSQLAAVAEILAHQVHRLVLYRDNENIESQGDVLGHLSFWMKPNLVRISEGIDPLQEFEYENKHPVKPYLADCLFFHYEDTFGKTPFGTWKNSSMINVTGKIVEILNLLAYGGLKVCLKCPICRGVIK
jgi:hypothetical protein